MSNCIIEPLHRSAQHASTLADWHYLEWQSLFGAGWTHAAAMAELQAHAQGDALETTLLARDGETLLGSVSLLQEDAAELQPLGSPWLASLYVRPEARGRGLGADLVRALLTHAMEKQVKTVYLFTPKHADFYRRLGWCDLCRAEVHGSSVQVMRTHIDAGLGA